VATAEGGIVGRQVALLPCPSAILATELGLSVKGNGAGRAAEPDLVRRPVHGKADSAEWYPTMPCVAGSELPFPVEPENIRIHQEHEGAAPETRDRAVSR
jgi:hypothetical protein